MTEVRFYHLTGKTLEQALIELLGKALEKKRRAVVRTADKTQVEALNETLWTYRPESFLPHGSAKDGYAKHQPVWLTAENDNPNGADMLILTGGANSEGVEAYALCCDLFDGRNDNAVATARTRWKFFKDKGMEVTYWQQTERGWEKKA